MVAVAFVLLWSGYSGGLWGWCLLRGYDVTLGQLVSPAHPYSGGWPPKPIPDTQVWPGGTTAAGTAAAGASVGAAISSGATEAVGILGQQPATQPSPLKPRP